jgi:hypothetical protein
MVIDPTVTIGNIVEIAVLAIGGISAIVTVKSSVGNMKTDLVDLKAEIKKLGEVMVEMADIRGELKVGSNRIAACEQDIRELRHGRGFISQRSDGGVNGEWP